MPQTFDQLISEPTKEQLLGFEFALLQGIGLTANVDGSPGTVTATGSPSSSFAVVVKIIAAGDLGTGTFQVSTDGGVTFSSTTTIPSNGIYALAGIGCSLFFANGPSGNVSFLLGDRFSFSLSPATFPVTTWQADDVSLTLLENDATALTDLWRLVKNIARGGYPSLASLDWLVILADDFFDLQQGVATVTQGVVTLSDPAGNGPYVLTNGSTWFISDDGLRYVLSQDVTVPLASSVSGVVVRAESPGEAYNVANGTLNRLATSVPGLSVANPDPGSGSWVTSSGTDAEDAQSLARRCVQRWPTLGRSAGTDDVYDLWARAADGTVTRTSIHPSLTVAGRVDVLIAGAAGALSGGVVATVQAYIDQKVGLCTSALVASTTNHVVTLTGFVDCIAAQLSAAQAAVDAALDELASITAIAGTLYFSVLDATIQNQVGVRDSELATPPGDVVLGAGETLTFTNSLVFRPV